MGLIFDTVLILVGRVNYYVVSVVVQNLNDRTTLHLLFPRGCVPLMVIVSVVGFTLDLEVLYLFHIICVQLFGCSVSA